MSLQKESARKGYVTTKCWPNPCLSSKTASLKDKLLTSVPPPQLSRLAELLLLNLLPKRSYAGHVTCEPSSSSSSSSSSRWAKNTHNPLLLAFTHSKLSIPPITCEAFHLKPTFTWLSTPDPALEESEGCCGDHALDRGRCEEAKYTHSSHSAPRNTTRRRLTSFPPHPADSPRTSSSSPEPLSPWPQSDLAEEKKTQNVEKNTSGIAGPHTSTPILLCGWPDCGAALLAFLRKRGHSTPAGISQNTEDAYTLELCALIWVSK